MQEHRITLDRQPTASIPYQRKQRLALFLCGIGLGGVGLGFDASLIGGLLSNPQWSQYFALEEGLLLGFTIGSWVLGAILAAAPAAHIADWFGRKRAIMAGDILNIVAIIVQVCCTNIQTFIVGRIISGMATAILITAGTPYLNELCFQYRGQLTAISQTSFFFGSIPAAWAAYGGLNVQSEWSWRLVLLLQLPWPIIQFIVIQFVPESPRWHVLNNRPEEAREILRYLFDGSGRSERDILEEVETTLGKIQSGTGRSEGSWKTFLTKPYRQRLFLIILLGLGSQWVGNGIISYYLAPVLRTVGIVDSMQQTGLLGGLQIVNWTASTLAALQCDRFGRRSLLVASAAGMLVSMSVLTACSAVYARDNNHLGAAIMVVVMIFVFSVFYDIGFTPVPMLYITELVPTEMRAKAASAAGGLGAIAIFINQWMNPVALSALQWRYYFVYIAVLVVMTVALTFAPETKRLSLEEATQVCEQNAVAASEQRRTRAAEELPS